MAHSDCITIFKEEGKHGCTQKTARIVGALFLIAMATSLIGGIWLESMLSAPDYLPTASANEAQVIIGVLPELVNCVAVVGIAVMVFPIFRQTDEALALGYVALRILEVAILVTAVVSPLALIALSQEYQKAGARDPSQFQTLGTLLMAARAFDGSVVGGILQPGRSGVLYPVVSIRTRSTTYSSLGLYCRRVGACLELVSGVRH